MVTGCPTVIDEFDGDLDRLNNSRAGTDGIVRTDIRHQP